jgi:hypothetical protein
MYCVDHNIRKDKRANHTFGISFFFFFPSFRLFFQMRFSSLSAELDAITREFDYGIVPGSATVFVRDEANGIGRLDLTLLEGVMIIVEVTDQGYRVNYTYLLSCSY